MQRNHELIERSDLLAIILEKIETSYAEDVSLLVCYGSYVTGEYAGMSDIDFFFVPGTNRGYALEHQFILNGIGYDLWPVSWERLKGLSTLEQQPASMLMDGEVLYAASEDDLRRLEQLKINLTENLKNDAVVRKMSAKYIEKAKAVLFDLQNHAGEAFFVDAIQSVESLLVAIAILNGTYVKKGLKRIDQELDRLSRAPAGFRENYAALIRTDNKADVLQIVHELILGTDELWKAGIDQGMGEVDPAQLAGFYEEFKSTYNKLLRACDEKEYAAAYYAAFMIDRETQSFLTRHAGSGTFPKILPEVLKDEYDAIRTGCLAHEGQLLDLLKKNDVEIKIYQDRNEFRQRFLEKTT